METRSIDGTIIAYSTTGDGPPVVIVDGIMCSRGLGPSAALAKELAARGHTAITYDRRGRGESGNTAPWTPQREIEDIAALVHAAGGTAALLGISSGAVLALDAAAALPGVARVVAFEPPLSEEHTQDHIDAHVADVEAHLAAGRNGAAVAAFLDDVGMPRPMLALMKLTPTWRKLQATAPTMPHDLHLIAECLRTGLEQRWTTVDVPVLVLDGGKSPEPMRAASAKVAQSVPAARHQTLPGQTHLVKAKVLSPVVAAFLAERQAHQRLGSNRSLERSA
jgi:pimeloyl-ACP methyl ester carboxylesterase